MINNCDIISIDHEYFDVVETSPFYLVLRSKNTGHYWYLLEQDYKCFHSFRISHKHHETDSYHPQTCKETIEKCCTYIKEHDAFHLKRVHKKIERRRSRLRR